MTDLAWFIAGMGFQGLLLTTAVAVFPGFFRGAVSEAQVEAAVHALWEAYDPAPVIEPGDYAPMRAALEAAKEVR
jgi:predicted homoserine dehydrogenase-like protein